MKSRYSALNSPSRSLNFPFSSRFRLFPILKVVERIFNLAKRSFLFVWKLWNGILILKTERNKKIVSDSPFPAKMLPLSVCSRTYEEIWTIRETSVTAHGNTSFGRLKRARAIFKYQSSRGCPEGFSAVRKIALVKSESFVRSLSSSIWFSYFPYINKNRNTKCHWRWCGFNKFFTIFKEEFSIFSDICIR